MRILFSSTEINFLACSFSNFIELPPSPCRPNPCVRGTCTENGLDFLCQCEPGFTGLTCDTGKYYNDLLKSGDFLLSLTLEHTGFLKLEHIKE